MNRIAKITTADNILLQISNEIHVFRSYYGITPNHMTLGRTLFNYIIAANLSMLCVPSDNKNTRIFGLDVTVDYENPFIISVGMASSYTVPEYTENDIKEALIQPQSYEGFTSSEEMCESATRAMEAYSEEA